MLQSNWDEYVLINKKGWDLRTDVHLNSKFYDVPSFIEGKTSLNIPELELLQNIKGKRLLHLQCHFGLDTLSLARLGAIATGIDLSTKAIDTARKLSKQSGIRADFIEADVHNLKPHVENSGYDFVFSSYGVICWIADLKRWVEGIKHSLKSGGRFVLVEFHPILDLLFSGSPYFNQSSPFYEKVKGTYADSEADLELDEYCWQHPISEIVKSFLDFGFKLIDFNEYPYCPYKIFPGLDLQESQGWVSSEKRNSIPYLYSLVVEKE